MRVKAAIDRVLPKQTFARNVSVLAGGTAISQGLGILLLPVITRLYTPADFSMLAVFSSILGIFAVVACLRLDIAIPLPERDEDAANLLAIALLFTTALATLIALVVWWFPVHIARAVGQPRLQRYLWMIPLGIWLVGTYSAMQFWFTRKKRFTAIVRTRVIQTTGSAATQLGFGLLGSLGPVGLLLGQLIGSGAGVLGLGQTVWRNDLQALRKVNWANLRRVLGEYDQFPKYSTFEALANNGTIQLSVIVIAAVTQGPEAGYLFLAMKTMTIPIGLIGGAVAQVYLSRASDEFRANRLNIFTLNIFSGLMRTGVGPLIFLGIIAPTTFPLIFGSPWERAGQLVAWMTPWIIFQFISSPISMVMHVTGRQREMMWLTLATGSIRVATIVLAFSKSPNNLVEYFCIGSAAVYIIYSLAFYNAAGVSPRKIKAITTNQLRYIILWIFMAMTLKLIIGVIFL